MPVCVRLLYCMCIMCRDALHAHVWTCTWRLRVNFSCRSSSTSHYGFETGQLIGLGVPVTPTNALLFLGEVSLPTTARVLSCVDYLCTHLAVSRCQCWVTPSIALVFKKNGGHQVLENSGHYLPGAGTVCAHHVSALSDQNRHLHYCFSLYTVCFIVT